ncbi:MAG: cyclic pyranopterin monophosphate synthase MoaC [Desulfatibacillaceae bacterium]|nr:cyclic pyranopterin monophosphate synthase MoaC [Desulfatibacillaceae bacterium]
MNDTKKENSFSHLDKEGRARMVDVSAKAPTLRQAVALARVCMKPDTLAQLLENKIAKGNVLETARIAAIMAAKRTWELIPLCHPLALSLVDVSFEVDKEKAIVNIKATARANGPTGVEMEALTAAAVAGLTIYDMLKALDRTISITDIMLLEKSGGKSGHFVRPNNS